MEYTLRISKKLDKQEPVIPLMYLKIMANYQSQECLVISILVNKITDLRMFYTHGGKNIMVCLACTTLPCTPVCTGNGRTTPEMMSDMNICHITLNIMTNELRRSDLERKNILKNPFFI